jgi:hypothetical protein
MTILDATHKLFDYFATKDSFCVDKDFKNLIPISEDKDLEVAVVLLALGDMEKNELVKSTKIEGKEHYILSRPLESFEQNVSISYPTAIAIARELNEFCEILDDYTDVCEVGNVTEKDVRNLVILNQHHKTEMTKLIQKEENGGFNLGDT